MIIILMVVGFLIFRFAPQGWEAKKMVSPFSGIIQTPSPLPSPSPKMSRFDSSTDLKKELETVDPKILDEDFKNL